MSIGMTADEFWYGPPLLANAHREAHKLKVRHENEIAWLQGTYNLSAFRATLFSAFGKKGGKVEKYAKEPHDLGLKTEAEKRIEAQEARKKIVAILDRWKASWDKSQIKSGEQS